MRWVIFLAVAGLGCGSSDGSGLFHSDSGAGGSGSDDSSSMTTSTASVGSGMVSSSGMGGSSSSSTQASSSSGMSCPPDQTACGVVCFDLYTDNDNCGQCGNKCSEEYQICGGAPWTPDGVPGKGKPGVCGGGCTYIQPGDFKCSNWPETPYYYQCTVTGTTPPAANCRGRTALAENDEWCCSTQP